MSTADTETRSIRITLQLPGAPAPETRELHFSALTPRIDGMIRRATGAPLRTLMAEDTWGSDTIAAVWWAAGRILGRDESLDELLDIPIEAWNGAALNADADGDDPEA